MPHPPFRPDFSASSAFADTMSLGMHPESVLPPVVAAARGNAVPVHERRIGRALFALRAAAAVAAAALAVVLVAMANVGFGGGRGLLSYAAWWTLPAGLCLGLLAVMQFIRHAVMPRLLDIGFTGRFRPLVLVALFGLSFMFKLGALVWLPLFLVRSGAIRDTRDTRDPHLF